MRNETLLIDLCDPGLREYPILKQGDTTRLDFFLTKGNEIFRPDTCTVLLCATRADGMAVVQADDITFQGGGVSILLDPRIVAVPGAVRAELQFSRDGELISSYCFTLSVQASAVQSDVIAPEEENRFEKLILAVSKLLDAEALPESVEGNLPCIAEGGTLKDSGVSLADLAPAVHAHEDYASVGHTHEDLLAASAISAYQPKEVNGGGYFTATTVEGILLEIGSTLNGLEADLAALL